MLIGYPLLMLLASGAIGRTAYRVYRKNKKKAAVIDSPDAKAGETNEDAKWLQSLHGVHGCQESNKRLTLAGGGFTLSLLGGLGVPQAGLLALPLIGASTAAIVTDAIRLIRRRERVAVALIDLSGTAIRVSRQVRD